MVLLITMPPGRLTVSTLSQELVLRCPTMVVLTLLLYFTFLVCIDDNMPFFDDVWVVIGLSDV